jgi:putative iron-dependent peroxidase
MTKRPPVPQSVLTPMTPAAIFVVMTVDAGQEAAARDALADVSSLVRAVGIRSQDGGLTCVTGVGSDLWDRAFTGPKPAGLHPFKALDGGTHQAPSTPGDLLFHIRAGRMDLCFELAHRLAFRFRGIATTVDEVHGFRYWDARNMMGFVDGTENPRGIVAEDVVFADPEATHPNSSYVIVQRYTHDMDGWHGLTVEDQEAAFGRTKLSDMEIPDDEKAANSHLTLNTVEDDDGTERQILRDNMPFGRIADGTYGTYFIGYAADVSTTETMLERMFIGDPPGTYDRILDFSTAQTGSLFFVPSQDELDDPSLLDEPESPVLDDVEQPASTAAAVVPAYGGEPAEAAPSGGEEAADADPEASGIEPSDGSLNIGALRGTPQRP